jgi:hypothetical protein
MIYLVLAALISAPSWPPPQMPTEAQFKEIQGFSKASRLAPSGKAPVDVLASDLPAAVTPEAQKKAVERFKNAWFLGSKFFGKQQVEVDVFHLPNPELSTVKYVWTSATGADGKSQLQKTAAPAETLDMRSGSASIPLENKDDESEIIEAKAKVSIEIPEGFEEATFSCQNAGKKEVRGSLRFTLERCESDVFSMVVEGLDDMDRVIPLNAAGAPLAHEESNRSALFADGKRLEDITYEQFKQGPNNAYRVEMRAKGTVASVRWVRVKAMKKIALDMTALPEVKVDAWTSTSRPRFIADMTPPKFSTIDSKTFAASFASGRSCAMFGHNAPQLWLQLPELGNSQFANVELKGQPKVSGAKGGFELETNGYDERHYRYKWTLNAKKENSLLSFTSVDVKATVHYPVEIVSVELSKTKPSGEGANVVIEGHRVTVQLPGGSELLGGALGMRALDASGAALKVFSYTEASDSGETHAFMGQVDKVRINFVRAWADKTVSGKLKPAPLRSKEKAGICD